MMQKRLTALLFAILLAALGLFGCGPKSRTLTLNTVNKFFSGEALLEATARELEIDGNDATVRIRVMNVSGDAIGGFGAKVEFLDEAGNVLFTDVKNIVFEVALENFEGVTLTAECSGKNVDKITAVVVKDS